MNKPKERLTQAQKDAKGKQWYIDKANYYDSRAFSNLNYSTGFINDEGGYVGGRSVNEYKRKKVNYDLFNNIIDIKDFKYVCEPYGLNQNDDLGNLPANFTNRDISSVRIKAILGLEMGRPFSYKVIATNEEATTRVEEEEFGRIREFVVSEIMRPIKQEIELKYAEQIQDRQLTPDEQNQIQQQIAQEIQAQTPEEVSKYMRRKHQDPAEALAHQILQYLIHKQDIKRKFNKGFKHACLASDEVYWVGIINGEPEMKVINPLYFDYDKSPDLDFIEDGEWAVYEYWLSPSEVMMHFGDDLTNEQIDQIYEDRLNGDLITDNDFTFDDHRNYRSSNSNLVRCIHIAFKALRRVGFLLTADEEERIEVDENYKLRPEYGDIDIQWEWIPETHEVYKLGHDIIPLKYARPIPGQFKDLDNLYHCKLPYYGATYENDNSDPVSLMGRMKPYQYYYNIIMYRLELLMASDKGRIMLMNMNMIPKSQGIDIKKWLYYADALKIGFMNPAEEGNRNNTNNPDITNAVKEIDWSLASDIQRYISLAEYIDKRCGDSIGVSDELLGQIMASQRVTNTQQALTQTSKILEPHFEMHSAIKKNVIQALIDTAKVAYSEYKPKKTRYVLDDLGNKILDLDPEMLDNSTYGIFVSNAANAHQAKEDIRGLAHAALQTQITDLSDIAKVLRSEGIQEAEELLEQSEEKKKEERRQEQMAVIEAQAEENEKEHSRRMEEKQFDRETQIIIQDKKNEADLRRQVILATGFNEDKDMDDDGKLDVVEIATNLESVEMDKKKQSLEEKKQAHAEKVKERELDQMDRKLDIEEKKAKNSNSPKK